jgi:hypothetical protein
MAKNSEIQKNIKFYLKEMAKWEFRLIVSLTLIFSLTLIVYLIYLYSNNWDVIGANFEVLSVPNLCISTPVFYLMFSVKQFNYYKKKVDFYKYKNCQS